MTITASEIAQVKGEASKRSLKRFVKEFWPVIEPVSPFQDGYHVDALCDHLTHLKQIRNLMVNMPPRVGKSSLLALWFAWTWASIPSTRFIFSSYSLPIAIKDSLKSRNIIKSDLYKLYYPYVELADDQDTKQRFENSKTGMRLATSIEGSLTGEGGNVICSDDPHNLQEAASKASRDSVIRWFTTVWQSRLNDPATGCRLLVMQRCAQDDVSGYLLKHDVENNWTKLILPLEAGRSKFVSTRFTDTRQPGELLCPARIPPQEVTFLRSALGKRAFDCQYNQNPAPDEDALFKVENFRYYDELPPGSLRIAAVDLSFSGTGDYTVLIVADVHRDGNVYVVHMHREKMTGPKLVPAIKAIHAAYNPTIIFIEDAAFQRIIIQECRMQKMPVRGVKPEGNKESRSVMLQVKLENNQLFLPKGKTYNDDILDELTEFPNGSHDDIVDSLSYLVLEANNLYRRIPEKKQELTEEEKKAKAREEYEAATKEDEKRRRQAIMEGLV